MRFHIKYPILTGNNGNYNGFYFQNDNTIYDKNLLNKPLVYNFEKNDELTDSKNKFNELEIFEIL